jgi:orotidine-5'-phosphate decarboxylase
MQARDRLIVALDVTSRDEVLALVDELHGIAGTFKIGLQAFVANGPDIVREVIARGERVFLDLKIHDIPNTARHAVASASSLGASIITVHAAGGEAMLRAAAESAGNALILGVTMLTSIDEAELQRIGFGGTPLSNAVHLAKLVRESRLRGVVVSPREISAIREACGSDFVILTPGIRAAGSDRGDQRRTMTAREAIAAGADYIVVGRPITAAPNRRDAAVRIIDEVQSGIVA